MAERRRRENGVPVFPPAGGTLAHAWTLVHRAPGLGGLGRVLPPWTLAGLGEGHPGRGVGHPKPLGDWTPFASSRHHKVGVILPCGKGLVDALDATFRVIYHRDCVASAAALWTWGYILAERGCDIPGEHGAEFEDAWMTPSV